MKFLIALLLSVPAWSQSSQFRYYFPFAPEGRTSIHLTNSNTTPARVTMGTTTFTLAAGASRVEPATGESTVVNADVNIGVWGVLASFDSAETLRGEAGFASAELSPGFRIPVDTTEGISTSVALYNPGPGPATITASLEGESTTLTLDPGARTDYSAASGLRGTLNLNSTVAICAHVVRQRGAVTAILEAPMTIPGRMRFYLPLAADGPSVAATLRTRFLLTNLTDEAATVTLALTMEDGTPWSVGMQGMDSNSTFVTTIEAGASAFLQTDGAGPLAEGAVSIRSDQPIGVQAMVAAVDAQGATLSETAIGVVQPRPQFVMPMDPDSEGVFYNTGSTPVTLTLTLKDASGKAIGAPKSATVPARGRFTAALEDLFPGVTLDRGSVAATSDSVFMAALAVRRNRDLPWPSALPAAALPLTGVPIKVTPVLDVPRAVSANIGPTGGSLTLTDANRNRFVLTIPPFALLSTEKIVMTPVTSAQGMVGTGLVAVQLEPDGLQLLGPATLNIQRAAAAPSTGTEMPVGWYGSSAGIYLNPRQPVPGQTVLRLDHFSGAGTSSLTGGDLTRTLLNIIDLRSYYSSVAQSIPPEDSSSYQAHLDAEYNAVIVPLMQIAASSRDTDVLLCAARMAMAHSLDRARQPVVDRSIELSIHSFARTAIQIAHDQVLARCTRDHDFLAAFDLIELEREARYLGFTLGAAPVDMFNSCPAQLELDFKSQMQVVAPNLTFKGSTKAKFLLHGRLEKSVLESVGDPSKDLLTSYLMNGSGDLSFDPAPTVTIQGECSGSSILATSIETMTIEEQQNSKKSHVQFKFSAAYQPAPRSLSGTQLCSNCPVHQKKPVKVELLMHPTAPKETTRIYCEPPLAKPVELILDNSLWWAGWKELHPPDQPGSFTSFIVDWELPPNHDPYARKLSNLTLKNGDTTFTEQTVIKLASQAAR